MVKRSFCMQSITSCGARVKQMFVPVQAEAKPLPAPFYSFLHVLCVLRALQRTQNTQNMYYNVGLCSLVKIVRHPLC